MLPLGYLGKGFGKERKTNLTLNEQITMMTLWCIFRSPLMLGCELTKLDEETLKLLTNESVLRLLKHSYGAKQIIRNDDFAIWCAKDSEDNSTYVALFNFKSEKNIVQIDTKELIEEDYIISSSVVKELWSDKSYNLASSVLSAEIETHGAKLFHFE
jgi:FAD synthase